MNEQLLITSEPVDELDRMIEDKREYLQKLTHPYAINKVQAEILFLKSLRPILLRGTSLLYHEVADHVNEKVSEAVKHDAHAMIIYLPLIDSGDEFFNLAVVNPYRDNPIEGLTMEFELEGRMLNVVQL